MATILDVPQGNRIAAGVNRVLGSILNFWYPSAQRNRGCARLNFSAP